MSFLLLSSVAQAQVNILPLGNSITQADSSHNSYRRPLAQLLLSSGFNFNFVGSDTLNHLGPHPNPDFDLDHEGHWGWRIDELLNGRSGEGNLSAWLQGYYADAALVHVGTNDLFQGQGIPGTIQELGQLIDTLRAYQPGIVIFLAKLIPTSIAVHRNAWINQFNDSIPSLAASKFQVGSPIIIVDQNSGFDPTMGADTYDQVHPNNAGDLKMALKWRQSILAYYQPLHIESLNILSLKRSNNLINLKFEVQGTELPSHLELEFLEDDFGQWQHHHRLEHLSDLGTNNVAVADLVPEAEYFRIISHGADGDKLISNVVKVNSEGEKVRLLRADNSYFLSLRNVSATSYQLSYYSIIGASLFSESGTLTGGDKTIELNSAFAEHEPILVLLNMDGKIQSFRLLPTH